MLEWPPPVQMIHLDWIDRFGGGQLRAIKGAAPMLWSMEIPSLARILCSLTWVQILQMITIPSSDTIPWHQLWRLLANVMQSSFTFGTRSVLFALFVNPDSLFFCSTEHVKIQGYTELRFKMSSEPVICTKMGELTVLGFIVALLIHEVLCPFLQYSRAPRGSQKKLTAEKQLRDAIKHRAHIDESMMSIAKILFRSANGLMTLETVRPAGQPLVDDWSCFKALVRVYSSIY